MKWKRYPEYKDSGIELLGDVPEHWEVAPIRSFARTGYKTFTDGDWIESPYIRDEGIRLIQTGNIGIGSYREQGFRYIDDKTFHELRCTEILPGDVLICRLADPVGRACLAPDLGTRMITSVDVCILKAADDVDPGFVVYAMSGENYLAWMSATCRGGTRDRVSRSMLGSVRVIVPPSNEQKPIAAFLDRETERIDTLITKKERQIELLQEKRTALISHAVTKGLNPDVKMKDSGIDWLGKIPDHWEILSIKRITSVPITDGPHETPKLLDEGIPFISAEAIKNDKIDFAKMRGFISLENHANFSRKYKPRRGDIYLIKSGATTGNVAFVDTDDEFNIWSPLAAIRPDPKKAITPFVFFFMKSKNFFQSIELGWSYGTQQNIGMNVIENIPIALPPLEEQESIAALLNANIIQIDEIASKVENSIDLLHEYRTALISAAVTGKIDVRKEVA